MKLTRTIEEEVFMFKKLVCTLLLLTLFVCGCAKNNPQDDLKNITKRGKLIVGVRNDTKPFGYKDINGTIQGYDIDLAKLIARDVLGDENAVEFVPVNASNRISKLNSREVDILIATMSITSQRQLVADFSVPYHVAGQAILVKKGSDITSLRQLNKRKVIIIYGSTGEVSIRMNVPDASIIGYKSYLDGFNALKNGEADAMIADDTILLNLSLNDSSVKILPKRYSREPYAVAFRRGGEADSLRERVNFLINNLLVTGKLEKMQQKWEIK